MPTKKATPIDYKKVFSDQVRKGFTGDHNMNVAQGAYTMTKGSAPRNIDGTPMYGTIGQMKDKAAYKHGMHGDRNSMGKKAMSQKMNDYFPHQNLPAGDTNPNMQKNYLIQDASPIDTMGEYGMRQSKYLTEDGRAIDASKPEAQMKEAGTQQTDGGYQTGYGYNKKITDKKGKTISFDMNPNINAQGQIYKTSEFSTDPEAGFRQPLVMGSESPDNIYIETGGDKSLVDHEGVKAKATYTYTNKRGKSKSAEVGTRKADRIRNKFSRKLQKLRKSGKDKDLKETNLYEKSHKKVAYNKGGYEATYRGQKDI